MSVVSAPGVSPVDEQDPNGMLVGVTTGWRNFFNSVFNVCNALTMSGTTANRPTKALWTGRTYFDTTLGIPIWYKTAGWVDATGAAA